jgi:hypothetical protein
MIDDQVRTHIHTSIWDQVYDQECKIMHTDLCDSVWRTMSNMIALQGLTHVRVQVNLQVLDHAHD